MKSFARSYVWWPGMDRDLERKVQQCILCQRNRKNPPKVLMHHWEWPEQLWIRLHVDHAGPVEGNILFLIVDAHSKWIDLHIVLSASATSAINKLRLTFATHGLPRTIVSDNGTAFTSNEFQEFLLQNGIEHVHSAPYHPSSNGLAERAVQTVKEGVKKMKGPLELKLSRFLFKYRVTPQTTTGVAPAELLMGRRLRIYSIRQSERGSWKNKRQCGCTLKKNPVGVPPTEGIAETDMQVAMVQSQQSGMLPTIRELLVNAPHSTTAQPFLQEQLKDPDIAKIIEYLEENQLPADSDQARTIVIKSALFTVIDNVLLITHQDGTKRVVVPTHLKRKLMDDHHRGHFGSHFAADKLYGAVFRHWWWQGMRRDISFVTA